jgi:hypothetical protein
VLSDFRPAGGYHVSLPVDGSLQIRQKMRAIYPMLATGVVHSVEAGNRTADAAHLVLQENADRRRPSSHDIVDELSGLNGSHHSLQSSIPVV